MKPVIICGGVGTKMWPESSPSMPKHFLPLISGKSLFQINWEDLRQKFEPEEIFLQTNEVQAKIAKEQVEEIVEENIFIEPEMRNQGPATGFAAAQLIRRGFGDEPFILIQADVLREPGEMFLEMILEMDKLAGKFDKYITGGVKPETIVRGVDYLVKGNLVSENGMVRIYEVADYIDRSEEDKIKKYLDSNKLLLHANHTTMTPNGLMKMYQKYKKEWYEPLLNIVNDGDVAVEYSKMPKAGIEEVTVQVYKNSEALVVELPFKWVDLGTWESVAKYFEERNLAQKNKQIEIEGQNNFVRSEKTVAIIGLSDLVVVDSPNGLLICPKSMTGKVGQVVEKIGVKN